MRANPEGNSKHGRDTDQGRPHALEESFFKQRFELAPAPELTKKGKG
jgi:hypothetical protein